MKFNMAKFHENLQPFQKQEKAIKEEEVDFSGMYKVIQHVWNDIAVKDIDFDAFTVRDALNALEAMDEVIGRPTINDDGTDDTEIFEMEPENPFTINGTMELVMVGLDGIERVYNEEEDFI